ncbi:MAG TPA: ABC transporter substrate-binding protein [Alphaproteobacteria bacterium]|jgi:phospholipid transport system substrate-binding protein|nr:ABC transporter substrate-binding protein [Alphaproteobacteria bacterium]
MLARIARTMRTQAVAGLAVLGVALAPAAVQAHPDAPDAVVGAYYSTLLNAMQNAKSLGYEGRFKMLAPVIKDTFDLNFMARYAIRGFWEKLDQAQQNKLVDEFGRLSAATYAARFNDYAGEQFKVLKSETTPQNDTFVYTQIVKSDGEPVPINYLLRKNGDDWRIIDVYLRGTISELAKWRADFSSVITRDGFDGLIAAIDGKVKALQAE